LTDTATKVSSRAFYHELRAVLGPLMKRAGFKVLGGGRLGWARQGSAGCLMLWFQCDKWGWSERWGSTFTLEFQLAQQPADAMTLRGRFERVGYVLEGFEALDELRARNNAVVGRLPGTLADEAVVNVLEDGTEAVVLGHRVDAARAIYGRDIWMNYHTLEDVREWARYFERNLLDFVALFEHERRSAEGMARIRFDRMMARIQSESDLAAKTAIFGEYIAGEPDAHFRAAAEHWLAHARAKLRP